MPIFPPPLPNCRSPEYSYNFFPGGNIGACDVLYDNGEKKATVYLNMGHFRGMIKRGRRWSGVVSKMTIYSNLIGGYMDIMVLVYY